MTLKSRYPSDEMSQASRPEQAYRDELPPRTETAAIMMSFERMFDGLSTLSGQVMELNTILYGTHSLVVSTPHTPNPSPKEHKENPGFLPHVDELAQSVNRRIEEINHEVQALLERIRRA